MASLLCWKRKCFQGGFEGVHRGFLSKTKGKVISRRRAEDGKGTGTNSGKSGMRILEAESIGSRAETTGECVKLTTVTEIRRSGELNVFLGECVCLVLNCTHTQVSIHEHT